jgi:hypothetical protein
MSSPFRNVKNKQSTPLALNPWLVRAAWQLGKHLLKPRNLAKLGGASVVASEIGKPLQKQVNEVNEKAIKQDNTKINTSIFKNLKSLDSLDLIKKNK